MNVKFESLFEVWRRTVGKIPLRMVLMVPFAIQIVGMVGLVGYLSFRSGQKAVEEIAGQLMAEVGDRVAQNLQTYLNLPQQVNRTNQNLIQMGFLNLRDLDEWERYLSVQVREFPDLAYIGVGNERCKYRSGEYLEDGSIRIDVAGEETAGAFLHYYRATFGGERQTLAQIVPNFNLCDREEYRAVVEAGEPIWTPVYVSVLEPTLSIARARPVRDRQTDLQGILIAALRLDRAGQFLRQLRVGKSGQVFIVNRDGILMATSTSELPFRVRDGDRKTLSAWNSDDRLTRSTARYLRDRFETLDNIKHPQKLTFDINNERHYIRVIPHSDDRGLDWLIAVVVPHSDFTAQIDARTRTTLLLCIFASVAAIAIGIFTSRIIVKPILKINSAAKQIARGTRDKNLDIRRPNELGELANSLNQIATKLEEFFATSEEKNREIEHLNRLKDEFLADTSHELRTPSNGIVGRADSMLDDADDYLPKPISKDELLARIKTHLKLRQLQVEALRSSPENEGRIAQFLEALPVGVAVYGADGTIVYLNPTGRQLVGSEEISAVPISQIHRKYRLYRTGTDEIYPPEELPFVRALAGETVYIEDIEIRHRDRRISCEVHAAPIRDRGGNITCGIVVFQDITDRRNAETIRADYSHVLETQVAERTAEIGAMNSQLSAEIARRQEVETILLESERRFRNAFEFAAIAIGLISPEGQIGLVNPPACQFFGYSETELRSRTIKDLTHPDDYHLDRTYKRRLLAGKLSHYNLDKRYIRKDGQIIWGRSSVSLVRDSGDRPLYFIAQLQDITEQRRATETLRRANETLERQNRLDGLTQVANRRHFDEYLHHEWQRLAREKRPLSLILCDVDYFKYYNDTYGHQAGDDCLRRIARAMETAGRRPADSIARYGGEEFAAILPETDRAGAIQVAERIRERVRSLDIPHRSSAVSHRITVSLGIDIQIPTVGESPERLIAGADRALYRAKREGRDRVCIDN